MGNILNFREKLIWKCYITDTIILFVEKCYSAVTKKYWAFKKEEILNLTVLALFSFFLTT